MYSIKYTKRCLFVVFLIVCLSYLPGAYCSSVYRRHNDSATKKAKQRPGPKRPERDENGFLKGFVKVKIYGNLKKFAYYYVYVGLGNPKVKQMLIIDTGSQLVNVACADCLDCGKHVMENYNYLGSITASPVGCRSEECKVVEGRCDLEESCVFSESYSEGSTVRGKYVGDLISLDGSKDSSDLASFFDYIGCVTEESSLIKSQISNGILGLSKSDRPSLVDHEYRETQSFIEKYLTDHFRPRDKVFSLCLSEEGGIMTLGGHDRALDLTVNNVSQMTFVPLVKSEFYVVRVYSLGLRGESIESALKNFVLDTGTTVSTFASALFARVFGHFKAVCDEFSRLSANLVTVPRCRVDAATRKVCFSEISRLPQIRLVFEKWVSPNLSGAKFDWAPDSYMLDKSERWVPPHSGAPPTTSTGGASGSRRAVPARTFWAARSSRATTCCLTCTATAWVSVRTRRPVARQVPQDRHARLTLCPSH